MTENVTQHIGGVLDKTYRSESRRILATLIHLLGDFELAEESMHDAKTIGFFFDIVTLPESHSVGEVAKLCQTLPSCIGRWQSVEVANWRMAQWGCSFQDTLTMRCT